jgi:hypothetical protein
MLELTPMQSFGTDHEMVKPNDQIAFDQDRANITRNAPKKESRRDFEPTVFQFLISLLLLAGTLFGSWELARL